MTKLVYKGIWPVAPTPFSADGVVDYKGMTRVLDCMIDQGVDGICILANFSEQFLIQIRNVNNLQGSVLSMLASAFR